MFSEARSPSQNSFFVAQSVDNLGVPEPMHVGSLVEEPDLSLVASLIRIVADMHRHVQILNAMDQEPEANRRSSTDCPGSWRITLKSWILSTTYPFRGTSPEKSEL